MCTSLWSYIFISLEQIFKHTNGDLQGGGVFLVFWKIDRPLSKVITNVYCAANNGWQFCDCSAFSQTEAVVSLFVLFSHLRGRIVISGDLSLQFSLCLVLFTYQLFPLYFLMYHCLFNEIRYEVKFWWLLVINISLCIHNQDLEQCYLLKKFHYLAFNNALKCFLTQ